MAAAVVLGLGGFAQPGQAETLYRWIGADGTIHFDHSQPGHGIAYEAIEVPDPVRWYNAPDMLGEAPPAAGGGSTTGLFKSASESVYAVVGHLPARPGSSAGGMAYGSAVAITDKLALTNCHIIEDAGEQIYLGGGDEAPFEQAKIEGADYDADRCVLRVQSMDLHPVPGIRRFDALEVGETVFAIGNPRRLDRTLSQGLLSAKRTANSGRRYLQTTAPISPGSSGGGLFDARGNLIGITAFTLNGAQNINFALPAEDFWK